jgi:hypothetical protein
MLTISTLNPSPLVQTAVYMAGILAGYLLLVHPDEWQRAWQSIRDSWSERSRD